MKIKFLGFLVGLCMCSAAFAAIDAYTGVTVKSLAPSIALADEGATANSYTGTAVDVFGGKGIGVALFTVSQGTITGAVTVTLQDSANGSSGWRAVTNYGTLVQTAVVGSNSLAATYSHKVDLNNVRRYVRVLASGTNSAYRVTATLQYP